MGDYKQKHESGGHEFNAQAQIPGIVSSGLHAEKGRAVWLSGLSGAGKSTLARGLERKLKAQGQAVYVLDGDLLRAGLCKDLGFGDEARSENVRRIGEVARLFADAGLLVIIACIAPFARDRLKLRQRLQDFGYFEVFVDCPLEVCRARDPKGLYEKARQGAISQMTGIDSSYESPVSPELHLFTDQMNAEQCVELLMEALHKV